MGGAKPINGNLCLMPWANEGLSSTAVGVMAPIDWVDGSLPQTIRSLPRCETEVVVAPLRGRATQSGTKLTSRWRSTRWIGGESTVSHPSGIGAVAESA